MKTSKPTCNLCGGDNFEPVGGRKTARCAQCESLERTRAIKLILDELGLPKRGSRILHFAPEKSLSKVLSNQTKYEAVDLFPQLFKFTDVKKFDITTDVEKLPSKKYDLIIHSHVMEHIPCDITSVLYHIHRALKPGGWHIFCIPILSDTTYAEDLGFISREYATKEFGQYDHVRRWGSKDLGKTLGMALVLPYEYNLEKRFDAATLKKYAIPESMWHGYNPSSVLALRRDDMKLLGADSVTKKIRQKARRALQR